MLAQIVIDKYRYQLPEYRQARQYADIGLKLPTSTLTGWGHAVASRLEPVYEALRDDIHKSDYLQIDKVPLRIATLQERTGRDMRGSFSTTARRATVTISFI